MPQQSAGPSGRVTWRLRHTMSPKATSPAKDSTWNRNKTRGRSFVAQMAVSDKDAGALSYPPRESVESPFVNSADFKIWGYTDHVASRDFAFLPGGANIKEALEDLNIDTKLKKDGGSNEISAYRHTEERLIGSKTYKPSGARYCTCINASAGVIISWQAYSPAYMGTRRYPRLTSNFPELRFLSDIMYLQWAERASAHNVDLGNLRYVFSSPIDNEETRALIARATGDTAFPPPWAGRIELPADSEGGHALLGSPNGRGVAMMLIQHKKTMGVKVVDKIAVFGKGADVSLMFYIKNAVEEPVEELKKTDSLELMIGAQP